MRRNDWASRMHEQFDAHADREFAWGKDDCCLFVARTVDAMADTDFAERIAREYSDEITALRFIQLHGGLAEAVSVYLGAPVAARATRGDPVMVRGEVDHAMGICAGPYVVALGSKGLTRMPRSEILKVWKVWEKQSAE
jgi:hypothetical protein